MLIDNFASQDNSVELKINLINCDERLSLTSYPLKPRSKHEFVIYDAKNIGYLGKYNLTQEQSSEVFLLACSLLDPRKYLSFYQLDRLSCTLIPDKEPPCDSKKNCEVASNSTGVVAEITVSCCVSVKVSTHLTSQFDIDVDYLFWIIDHLLRYQIFNTQNRTKSELNVIDAMKLYRDSLSATDPRSCYLSMYAAFEKLVNAKDTRTGNDFDRFAPYFNGMKQVDIRYLRELDNRLKHPLRNDTSDLAILEKFEENPRLELKKLKTVTDPTILSTICKHFL